MTSKAGWIRLLCKPYVEYEHDVGQYPLSHSDIQVELLLTSLIAESRRGRPCYLRTRPFFQIEIRQNLYGSCNKQET